MIVLVLLETIGIGLVIPAISVLIDGTEGILKYNFFDNYRNDIKSLTDTKIAILIFSALFFIFYKVFF